MADPYDVRIRLAEIELDAAVARRDAFYPGSEPWELANVTVERWQATIRDLRDAADSGV